MASMFKTDGDEASEAKMMAQSIGMLENLADSGQLGQEQLDQLRAMLKQSMGMEVCGRAGMSMCTCGVRARAREMLKQSNMRRDAPSTRRKACMRACAHVHVAPSHS